MNKQKFLITGSTGATGSEVARLLLDKGHAVRALVHSEDSRSDDLKVLGAEISVGDLLDFDTVAKALIGTDGAYFVYPIKPGLIQATAYFAQAAKEAGLKTIVNMSQISSRRDSDSHAAQDHWVAERVFDWSGINTSHVRPTFFAEWLLYIAPIVGSGVVPQPLFPDSRHAPIAAEDQAKVIANILDNPEGHAGKIYPLFGAEELNQYEITEQVGKALGISVKYEQVDVTTFVTNIRRGGIRSSKNTAEPEIDEATAFLIQHLEAVTKDHKNGLFAGTNDIVETIGKTKPLGVEEFVSKNKAAFAQKQAHLV
ncbi:MAG: NmrA family NAD(P)-binding protein [Candidatus Melainabacteria bacterium]|nr:NmrA family NAD(P)-binding protein [Candidatus Melainabacteria bacterium]